MPQCVMERTCEPVQLEPFVHQVGGHASVLCFDEHTVCKPHIVREHQFYETLPDELKRFTPEYRGVVEVSFREDSQGYLTLLASCPSDYKGVPTPQSKLAEIGDSSPSSGGDTAQSSSDSDSDSNSEPPMRFRLRRSGSIVLEGQNKTVFELVNPISDEDHGVFFPPGPNPWSLWCHKVELTKMRKKSSTGANKHQFILLENLASHFELPCILDLKMGTRQHGDSATEEKRKKQMHKCQTSTSAALGVRICGMQVYQADTRLFICHNKYQGRRLDQESYEVMLYQFLHNGYGFRVDLIEPIIERLRQLQETVLRHDTFRFYSSSLLVMYEGAGWNSAQSPRRNDPEPSGSGARSRLFPECHSDNAMDGMDPDPDIPSTSSGCGVPHVDVRMIDFAHATYNGFRGDPKLHKGPDSGYLFGINNLIDSFKRLKENHIRHDSDS